MVVLEIIFIVLFLADITLIVFSDRPRIRYLESEVERIEREQSQRLSIYITEFDKKIEEIRKILELDK